MTSYTRHLQAFAAILSALAGFVDATGFLATGGFFVSFMSGNSTRLGIGAAQGLASGAIAGGLIAGFLAGVVAGALAGHFFGESRRSVVLGLVAVLLAAGAALGMAGALLGAMVCLVLAMGAMNNVFARNGEVSIGVTYMTGSLVKLGQRIAAALLGQDRFGWLSYLGLWLGFVAGVLGGALVYPKAGLASLWAAAGVAALLALLPSQQAAPQTDDDDFVTEGDASF
jgi:uncharacterized membrane protein YoaK (UPF0700 family)